MKKRLFIISGLRTPELRRENEEIAKIAEDVGFDVYLSQRVLPYGKVSDAVLIYEKNKKELDNSYGVVINANELKYKDGLILEGHGIEFEWGYAFGKKMPLVVYSKSTFTPFPATFMVKTKEELRQKLLLMKVENCRYCFSSNPLHLYYQKYLHTFLKVKS